MTTTQPPSEDLIRYDVMMQEALLGVVRKILVEAARHGLPGEHHFYITFRSEAPGVKLSDRLKEKYPEEMTIVLQHQFWDFMVGETGFEVGLSFGGVPEKLVVPFDALTGFYDPSVQFGLKFTPEETAADNDEGIEPAPLELPAAKPKKPARSKKDKAFSGDEGDATASAQAEPAAPQGDTPDAEPPPAGSAEVVSLDAFRKKK